MSKYKLIKNVELNKSYTYPNGLTFILTREVFSLNRKAFEVEFVNTHTKKIYSKTEIEFGKIIDYNSPTICKVGILGEDFIKKFTCISKYNFYIIWHHIISRCYNINRSDYKFYGGKGIVICEEWKYLENFYNWFIKQEYKDGYELDKDIIALANHEDENKIYSPKTCLLIPSRLNQFFITYKNKNSNIQKTAKGYQASVHFGQKMIRSNSNLTFEEAQNEKKRIKKECFLELNKELNLNKYIFDLCLKIFE